MAFLRLDGDGEGYSTNKKEEKGWKFAWLLAAWLVGCLVGDFTFTLTWLLGGSEHVYLYLYLRLCFLFFFPLGRIWLLEQGASFLQISFA